MAGQVKATRPRISSTEPAIPITIKEGARLHYPLSRPLPFSLTRESEDTEERVRAGSTSEVYKRAVEPGYFEYAPPVANTNHQPQIIAVKRFKHDSSLEFARERSILSLIFESGQKHKNVVIGWGSLVHGEETHPDTEYMIFLPWADCDNLQKFMGNAEHRESPAKRQNCIDTMVDVADGLKFLSEITHRGTPRTVSIMHCDIKPQNILVFRDHDKFTFKLSDFGHAYLRGEASAESNRFKNSYSPPEVDDKNDHRHYQDNSDVWSYGCVLLLVLLYTLNGSVQVTHLRNYLSTSDYDTFYDDSKKPFRLRDHTLKSIESLGSSPDPDAKELYLEMGRILKEDILVPDHRARKKISDVVKNLHAANRRRTLVISKSFADKVDRKKFDLCAVSAKAEYVCLGSNKTGDGKVILASNIISNDLIEVDSSIAYTSPTPWEQKFPLAASMCASSQIYRVLKRLERPKHYRVHVFGVEKNLDTQREIKIWGSEELTGMLLGRIAISPNGQWIATCRRVGNGHEIQILSRGYMESKSDRENPYDEPGCLDSPQPPQPQVLVKFVLNEFQTENVILDMCFTRANDNFVVVTIHNQNVLKFWYYQHKNSRWTLQDNIWKLNKGDFVSRNGLYTTMAPFNNSPGFLAIICTSRLFKLSPQELSTNEKRQINWDRPRFPAGHIEKVLLTEDDRFGIILCVEDGLLEVYVAWTKNINIIRKIMLSPDNLLKVYKGYDAGLHDKDGKLSLIIADPHKGSVFHVDITKALQKFEQEIDDRAVFKSDEIVDIWVDASK